MTEESIYQRVNRELAEQAHDARTGFAPDRPPAEGDYARVGSKEHDDVVERRRNIICSFRRSEKVIECRGVVGRLAFKEESEPRVGLPLGYQQTSDGVWRLSEFATRRRKRGKGPLPRHFPGILKVQQRGGTDGWRTTTVLRAGASAPYPQLPARVECPECHRERVLDPSRLDVDGRLV